MFTVVIDHSRNITVVLLLTAVNIYTACCQVFPT